MHGATIKITFLLLWIRFYMRFMQRKKCRLCVFHSTLFLDTVQFCVMVRVSFISYVFILVC